MVHDDRKYRAEKYEYYHVYLVCARISSPLFFIFFFFILFVVISRMWNLWIEMLWPSSKFKMCFNCVVLRFSERKRTRSFQSQHRWHCVSMCKNTNKRITDNLSISNSSTENYTLKIEIVPCDKWTTKQQCWFTNVKLHFIGT